VVKRDYYFDESISITLDYLRLLSNSPSAVVGRRS